MRKFFSTTPEHWTAFFALLFVLLFYPVLSHAQLGPGGGGGNYNPANVTITGGSINGTSIGLTATASIKAGSLTATVSNVTGTVTAGNLSLSSSSRIGFNADTFLQRESASILMQRNGVTAQGFQVSNSYTDAANNELGVFDWTTAANILTVGTVANGTGSNRVLRLSSAATTMSFNVNGSTRWTINNNAILPGGGSGSIGSSVSRLLSVNSSTYLTGPPFTVTASTYTVGTTDTYIISNASATNTITLPSAATFIGRMIAIKNIAAFTVISAASDVVPQSTATPGTAILAATAGKWAQLVSDGTNWVIMESN